MGRYLIEQQNRNREKSFKEKIHWFDLIFHINIGRFVSSRYAKFDSQILSYSEDIDVYKSVIFP